MCPCGDSLLGELVRDWAEPAYGAAVPLRVLHRQDAAEQVTLNPNPSLAIAIAVPLCVLNGLGTAEQVGVGVG